MKKKDLVILFCHEVSEKLYMDQRDRKSFFQIFEAWNWSNYTDFLYHLEEIGFELSRSGLNSKSSELLNCYFDYEEKFILYTKLFDFFSLDKKGKKYKNAPKLLSDIEDDLFLKAKDTKFHRERYIHSKYFKGQSLQSYSKATMASLMVSFGNDGRLDKSELDGCLQLLGGLKGLCPDFPLSSFDLSNALSFTEVSYDQMKKLKRSMSKAIKADGKVDAREVTLLKDFSSRIAIDNNSEESIERMIPFCVLAVLFSDGEVTLQEREWFLNEYDYENIISNIEEAFWFLGIAIRSPKVMSNESWFLSMIWNREKSFYDMANGLFLNFSKYFLKTDDRQYRILSEFVGLESSRRVKDIIKAHESNKVVEEEILLVLNLVFNQRYNAETINKFLTKEYLVRIFEALKTEESLLMYYATAQALFCDNTISSQEYNIVWKNFKSLKLDSSLLKETIFDHSLFLQRELEVGEYFTYLREEYNES